MLTKIINFYNQNAYFHSFVIAVEFALVSFMTSYNGGIPVNQTAWVSFGSALGGAVWAAVKRWLATNVATHGLNMKSVSQVSSVVSVTSTTTNTNQGNAGKI
jgi:hypothetical protein